MSSKGKPIYLALVLLSIIALPSASLPTYSVGDVIERRASYWPGMWQFDRGDSSGYGDYYYYGNQPRVRPIKRGYFWPGMWQFDRYEDDNRPETPFSNKRAYFWPGMWRHQQRRPSAVAKRSYGYGYYNDHPYWLGKACGETGDLEACGILSGLHYYY